MRDSYQVVMLADCCVHFGDGDWIETKDQSADGIRLIQTGNVGEGVYKEKADRARYISDETFRRLRCTELSAGDCLVSRLPEPVGRACVVPTLATRMITGVDCSIIRFDQERVLPAYFVYYSQSDMYLSAVDAATTGTTRNRISRKNLGGVGIPVPPLAEQRRIVAILDEAFEGIAIAKADAEQNAENARAIFEAELQSMFDRAWSVSELTALEGLATSITDGDHMPPPKSNDGVPFITIGNINKRTRSIDFTDTFKVPRGYYDALKDSRRPRDGDLLYTVTGSFGIPVLVDGCPDFCFQRHVGMIRPMPGVNSRWLYYLLLSPQVFCQAEAGATGTAQRTVSLGLLRRFEVPRVEPSEQEAVAASLDALLVETQHLESIYHEKTDALSALKMSLLNEAFSGNL